MMRKVKFVLLVAISAAVSYFFLLRPPEGGAAGGGVAATPPVHDEVLAVSPETAPTPAAPTNPPPVSDEPPAEDEATEQRPPSEVGSPDGEEDSTASTTKPPEQAPEDDEPDAEPENVPEGPAARVRKEMEKIAASKSLLAESQEEIRGEVRHGFETVLSSTAEDQFAIARFFSEVVVLVPRAGLDPKRPYHYRLVFSPSVKIEKIQAMLPVDRYRQYRDLLAYPYDALGAPLRELRRQTFARTDIFLYAALIPAREWALVIARRRQALAEFNGQTTSETPENGSAKAVRRFTMRYIKLGDGAFDIEVVEILFADGTKWSPKDRS